MLPLVGLIVAPRVSPLARQITRLFSGASGNLDPVQNTAACGLLVPLYAQYCRWVAEGRAPHAWSSRLPDFPHISRRSSPAPHIIAVQCESFVDPSRLSAPEHLRQSFRDACERSAFSGPLKVPAGGAYTMRSEFGFLSSLPEAELGTDRFNPYARAEKMNYPSLALTLREAGYRTEFVHPHDLRFFRRHLVLPALGFSHLHGDEAFAHAQRFGPHVGDLAVADYITRLLPASPDPRFVFAVTMENHGPWHRDRLADGEGSATELYLQHLRNSLEMIHRLQQLDLDRPLVLCFYGDHTPVLPGHFSPEQAVLTDYLIYHSDRRTTPIRKPAEVQNLSAMILRVAAPSDVHPSLTDLPLTSIAR
jgi:phosphoglycerol transferase MdoB-like AlkP superfamily enzyme